MLYVFAAIVFAIWIYLIAGRSGFWRADERHDRSVPPPPSDWPDIVAVIPARNEAETIGQAILSLLSQDYAGRLDIVLVDDGSNDGTAKLALDAAASVGEADRLTTIRSEGPPPGWTGKLWALEQGVRHAASRRSRPAYLLFTDADITHDPSALSHLASRAVAGNHVLTSVMAKLRCESFAERCAIPAFVYFFAMLYPFARVNRGGGTAAAAGGCMLIRTDELTRIGGLREISGELIDDCALARRLRPLGPIWLGLSEEVRSIRRYEDFGTVGAMIRRSAYCELEYSPPRLAASMAGMALIFLAPPLLMLFASGYAAALGAGAYLLMAVSFQPTLRLYRLNPLRGLALPPIAAAYMVWTIQSALDHARGRGGEWKGRFHIAAGNVR